MAAGPTSHALKALLPEHGTIWKDTNGELLKTIKVYFFEKETKWRCGKDIVEAEMVVGMVNTNWRKDYNRIRYGKLIPRFELVEEPEEANIRVKFQLEGALVVSYSRLGSEAEFVDDLAEPTMILDLRDMTHNKRQFTILHEFGHALGLGHEHQHPDYWRVMDRFLDEAKIYDCFEIIDVNEFKKQHGVIEDDGTYQSKGEYDAKSIMHYPTRMAMLKEEFQHLKTENDVDDDLRTGKITKEEAKFLKDFLSHINFVTSEPSMHDKEVLAKAYYEESRKIRRLGERHIGRRETDGPSEMELITYMTQQIKSKNREMELLKNELASLQELCKDIPKLEANNQELRIKLDEVNKKLILTKSGVTNLNRKFNDHDKLSSRVSTLRSEVTSFSSQIADLQQQQAQIQATLDSPSSSNEAPKQTNSENPNPAQIDNNSQPECTTAEDNRQAQINPLFLEDQRYIRDYKRKKRCKDCCEVIKACSSFSFVCCGVIMCLVGLSGLVVLLVSTLLVTHETAFLWDSDVVLLSNFDSVSSAEVEFTPQASFQTINFYPIICSDIKTERKVYNSTRMLSITRNTRLDIDSIYLIQGSEIRFTFTSSQSTSSSCIATISIFQNYSQSQLIGPDEVADAIVPYCVPSHPGSVSFTLSALNENRYYFIQVRGFDFATLFYGVSGNMLEYNVSNLSPIICPPSNITCMVSLSQFSGDEDVCVLASLHDRPYVSLNFTKGKTLQSHVITAGWSSTLAGFVLCGLFFVCMGLIRLF